MATTHCFKTTVTRKLHKTNGLVSVRNKSQYLLWVSNWHVGSEFYPIREEKRWGRMRQATRINLMRTWYDCWGTGDTHTHLCLQQVYSIGRECPEWSGRESGRDRYREIMGVRRIDSSLYVRACGRRWDAKTQCGKKRDRKIEGRIQKVSDLSGHKDNQTLTLFIPSISLSEHPPCRLRCH